MAIKTNHSSHNIPALRFPGFEGAWEKKKLGEITSFSKGKGVSKSEVVENGQLECIRYGELYTKYGETIDKVFSRTNLPAERLVLSEANDVIIPASGETQIDIATASCVLRAGIVLGGDLNILKTKNNGVFLSYYLNNRKKLDIANLAQGISVVHLYSSQLSLLSLNLPSLPEQQKIASFFTAIDKKITQLKQQKEKLELYKKGVMQQIFNQQLRFKTDDGNDFPEWKKKKLGEVAPLQRGFDLPISNIKTGEYPVVFSNGILHFHKVYKALGPGVITGRSGTIGKVTYVEENYWPHNTSLWVTDFKANNPKFIYYFYIHLDLVKFGGGSGVPTLNRNDVHRYDMQIPCFEEQTKISNFLSALDEKINKVQARVQQTVQWKKGLLQRMFV